MRKPRPRPRDVARMMARPINPSGPDADALPPLPLREIPPPGPTVRSLPSGPLDYVRAYRLGECSVIITRELGRWHLSIAHPSRYPTWDEIGQARYRLLPDGIWVGMYLPPRRHFVNLHRNCFQLFECPDPETSR